MDFLLLLPHHVRVILEVDGKHHYSNETGRADTKRYAAMAAADREMKLVGYDVFRFGAEELQSSTGRNVLMAFFGDLFRRYGVRDHAADAIVQRKE